MGRCNSYLLSRITAGPILESQPDEPQGLKVADSSSSSVELQELTTATGDDVLPASSLPLSPPAETSLPTEHWSKLPALRSLLAQEHPITETDLQQLALQLEALRVIRTQSTSTSSEGREGKEEELQGGGLNENGQ